MNESLSVIFIILKYSFYILNIILGVNLVGYKEETDVAAKITNHIGRFITLMSILCIAELITSNII